MEDYCEPTNKEKEDNREKITDPADFLKKYRESDEFKGVYFPFRAGLIAKRTDVDFEENVIERNFWGSELAEFGIVEFSKSNPKYRFSYTPQSVEPKTAEAIEDYIETIKAQNKFDRRGDIGDNQNEIKRLDDLRTRYHNNGADLVSSELIDKGAIDNVGSRFLPRHIGRGFLRLVAIQKLGVQGS